MHATFFIYLNIESIQKNVGSFSRRTFSSFYFDISFPFMKYYIHTVGVRQVKVAHCGARFVVLEYPLALSDCSGRPDVKGN